MSNWQAHAPFGSGNGRLRRVAGECAVVQQEKPLWKVVSLPADRPVLVIDQCLAIKVKAGIGGEVSSVED